MKQIELAEKSGKSQQYISLVVRGLRRPSYTTAKVWERLTGISIKSWMELDGAQLKALLQKSKKGGD